MRTWPAFSVILALAAMPSAAPALSVTQICINLKKTRVINLTGRLAMRTFPGGPNCESVADGDKPETVFILTLANATCADDGEFIGPKERFRTVHVFAEDEALNPRLRAFVGQRVTILGEGFGAHTGHHHAPLVLAATKIGPAR